MNILKAIVCWFDQHDWDEFRGMHNHPLVGSRCKRCGKWNNVQSEA